MKVGKTEKPYLIKKVISTEYIRSYNSKYGRDRICMCGHPYYRHFDTYEDMMAVGCKYCHCHNFEEAPPMPVDANSVLPMEDQLNEYHKKLEEDWQKEQEIKYQENYNNSI